MVHVDYTAVSSRQQSQGNGGVYRKVVFLQQEHLIIIVTTAVNHGLAQRTTPTIA